MEIIENILRNASELRKAKQYGAAAQEYEKIFTTASLVFKQWDAWNYIYSLQQIKNYERALELCRHFYPTYKEFEPLREAYAWCIYYTVLSKNAPHISDNEADKALQAIWKLYPTNKKSNPVYRASFARIKQIEKSIQPNWRRIWEILAQINPNELSEEAYTISLKSKKETELASDKEEWYSWASKATLQTENWDKCIEVCTKALQDLKKWHYSNDIWFKRRIAAALYKKGDRATAVKITDEILLTKQDWFIMADRALYTIDSKEALTWYARASIAFGDTPLKISMWEKMVQLLLQLNLLEEAIMHAHLVSSIRYEAGWPLKFLENLNETSYLDIEKLYPVSEIIKKLEPVWKNWLPDYWKLQYGKIQKILPNSLAGFIVQDGRKEAIYFRAKQFKDKPEKMQVGASISFWLKETKHPKTGEKSFEAIKIKSFENRKNS